jgi:hypothetical protein
VARALPQRGDTEHATRRQGDGESGGAWRSGELRVATSRRAATSQPPGVRDLRAWSADESGVINTMQTFGSGDMAYGILS